MTNSNLSDDAFFEFYCKSADVTFNNICSSDMAVFIKDINHTFRFISDIYRAYLNPNGTVFADDVLNKKRSKTIIDRNHQKFRDEAEAQDKIVQTNRTHLIYLLVDVYNHIFLIRKCPIINPATNNVVGILGIARPFMIPNMIDVIYSMNNVYSGSARNSGTAQPLEYELTPRQHMVLFLCLHKYSYTEIAEILTNIGYKISPGRVNEHIENLKYIFAVKSKEALIEEATRLRYHLFIPRKFLKVGSHALNEVMLISDS